MEHPLVRFRFEGFVQAELPEKGQPQEPQIVVAETAGPKPSSGSVGCLLKLATASYKYSKDVTDNGSDYALINGKLYNATVMNFGDEFGNEFILGDNAIINPPEVIDKINEGAQRWLSDANDDWFEINNGVLSSMYKERK